MFSFLICFLERGIWSWMTHGRTWWYFSSSSVWNFLNFQLVRLRNQMYNSDFITEGVIKDHHFRNLFWTTLKKYKNVYTILYSLYSILYLWMSLLPLSDKEVRLMKNNLSDIRYNFVSEYDHFRLNILSHNICPTVGQWGCN